VNIIVRISATDVLRLMDYHEGQTDPLYAVCSRLHGQGTVCSTEASPDELVRIAETVQRIEEEEREAEEDEDEDEDETCADCNGSGEGQYDGTSCRSCGGAGVRNPAREEREEEERAYWAEEARESQREEAFWRNLETPW